jgi:hypothetical protein
VGERIYGNLGSPEESIFATILEELRGSADIVALQPYIYESAGDEDDDEEAPGENRLPAIRLEVNQNPATPQSNVFEDNRMAVAMVCWVPGHHRGDAYGIQHLLRSTVSRQSFRFALSNATGVARAYPVGYQHGPVIRYASPRMMRAESIVTIEYRVATFKE